LVEQQTLNLRVLGSIPRRLTTHLAEQTQTIQSNFFPVERAAQVDRGAFRAHLTSITSAIYGDHLRFDRSDLNLAVVRVMAVRAIDVRRAHRSRVIWGARVRRFNQATWHGGVVLNMSMTGALLELTCRCEVGEWLVVEIECPREGGGVDLFTRCSVVVRNRRAPSTVVGVGFAPAKAQSAAS
jgi:hypothetical protein